MAVAGNLKGLSRLMPYGFQQKPLKSEEPAEGSGQVFRKAVAVTGFDDDLKNH